MANEPGWNSLFALLIRAVMPFNIHLAIRASEVYKR